MNALIARIDHVETQRLGLGFIRAKGSQPNRLSETPKLLAAQFVEQRLSLFQIDGIKALGEPVVDFGEH